MVCAYLTYVLAYCNEVFFPTDVGVIDKGKRHRIGDDIKTGNQIESVDINRSTIDHSSNVKRGHFERTGTDIERVDRDVSTFDRGTRIPTDTGLQMALKADSSMFKNVVKAYESGDFAKTDAEMNAVSASVATGMQAFVGSTGSYSHKAYARAFAELGVSTPSISPYRASITGQAGVMGESDKGTTVNLISTAFNTVQAHALKEGTKLGYSGQQLQSYVAARVGQFANSWMKYAQEERGYGAEVPGQVTGDTLEAGKPVPFRPPEERQKIAERLKNTAGRKIKGE